MKPPESASPMAAAMQWVARIMAAALMMVLPGLLGHWLGEQLAGRKDDGAAGSGWLALAGFTLGIVSAMYYLIAWTRRDELRRKSQKESHGE